MATRSSLRGNSLAVAVLLHLLILPSSAQVMVSPTDQMVAASGEDAAFVCIAPMNVLHFEWLINGTSLNDGHRKDGVSQETGMVLRFRHVPAEYNNTRIQCIADDVPSSTVPLLLVQGLLSAVGSLLVDDRVDRVYVNWTAPFTLDIPIVDPDIAYYCVDVVSSTSSTTLYSECGINVTEFTYPLPPRSWCDVYNITVTPVNVVGNGTSASKLFTRDLAGPEFVELVTTSTSFTLLMSALVCNGELSLEDIFDGPDIILNDTDLTIAESAITFSLQLLTPNRKYRVTVSASNANASATSTTLLSTHDIISCSTIQDSQGITVLVNFTEHSEATGALLNFIFINEDGATIDFTKSRSLAADRANVSNGLTLPLNIWSPGQYMLYVYDIESNKVIMDGVQYQASSTSFRVTEEQGLALPLLSQNCSITSLNRAISVSCSLPSRFQVTAQVNSVENVNILHINTSMDSQTPVTLQVTENGEYLLTILPIQDGRKVLSGLFSQIHNVSIGDVNTASTTTSSQSTPTKSGLPAVTSSALAASSLPPKNTGMNMNIVPSQLVVALGETTAFTCVLESNVNAEWLINGTSLNDGHRKDGVSEERGIQLRFLQARIEYNNTRIQCVADGVLSPESKLFVQGLLSAVGSLLVDDRVDSVFVNWTAPFTLDIPRVDPDIAYYCVGVVSSTSPTTLHSECGINVTEFTYPLPPRSWCDVYNITVTPVNVVGNGTLASKQFTRDLAGPVFVELLTTSISYTLLMSALVCSGELSLEDIFDGTDIILNDTDLTIAESAISFSSQLLTPNRKYRVTVSASNANASATSTTLLSTHDIISCSTIQDSQGINVLVNFTEHSKATGALLNFIFINKDGLTTNFTKSRSLAADRANVSNGLTLPLNIWSPGQYTVYVYDIESDKRIMDGVQYQASSTSFRVMEEQGLTSPLLSQNCSISSLNRAIVVSCSLPSRFQVTVQINAPDSVNILHVNTSMDPQTPVTLQVTENGEYLVTILPVQDGRGILSGLVFSQIHNVMVGDVTTFSTSFPTVTTSQGLSAAVTSSALAEPSLPPKYNGAAGCSHNLSVAAAFLISSYSSSP